MSKLRSAYMCIRRELFMDDEEQWHPTDLMWLGILAFSLLFYLSSMITNIVW